MRMRLVSENEYERVGELTIAAYASFTAGSEDPYVERLRDTAPRAAQAEVWVAVEDDLVVGTVTSCPPGSPWRELAAAGEGEFRMLAVDPTAQGCGVGRELVTLCERRARDQNATRMVLSSLAEMTAAHRLYDRAGYLRAPERDWDPVPGVHLLAFTKELT